MPQLKYLSPEWTLEAYRRLKAELTAEKMKHVTSSMLTIYNNCPDGKGRALYYKFVDGVIDQVAVVDRMNKVLAAIPTEY